MAANSILKFPAGQQIVSLEILNPELPTVFKKGKSVILDIKARDQQGRDLIIEMQMLHQAFFPKRVLYYWSKAYSRQLKAADSYTKLCPVYSINILDFELIPDPGYRFTFGIYEKDQPSLKLTDDLNIHWIELPKFNKTLKDLKTPEDIWIYLIKRSSQLKEPEMKAILDQYPDFKPVIAHIEYLSADEKLRLANEEYLDAERDLISIKEQGIIEGVLKGKAEGKAEGKVEGVIIGNAEGEARMLHRQMKLKFAQAITFEQLQKIMECRDTQKLESAADQLLLGKDLNIILKTLGIS